MKTKVLTVISSAVFISVSSLCGAESISATRTIQYPWINFANSSTLDIAQVELTDTATILHMNAYYRPKHWIQIDRNSTLKADGKNYALKGWEGITPDKHFWMPESGEAQFKLIFEPLPEPTQIFDFSEGDDIEGGFKLEGIDISGIPQQEYPEGVPEEVKVDFIDGPMPEQSFDIGETTLNIHLATYQEDIAKNLTLIVNSTDGFQEQYPLNVSRDGNATIKLRQYGTAHAYVINYNTARMLAQVTLWPGETVDCWIDTRIGGSRAMDHREDFNFPYKQSMHNGQYANFDRMEALYHKFYFPYAIRPNNFDYKISGKDYKEKIKQLYDSATDSISSLDIPAMGKEYISLLIKNDVLNGIGNYKTLLARAYMSAKNDWENPVPIDSIPATLTDADFSEVCKWFEIDDPQLLMAGKGLIADDWNAYGAKGDLSKSLLMYRRMIDKAKKQTIETSDMEELKSLSRPFFAEAIEAFNKDYSAQLAKLKENATVMPTPDVDDSEVFDAMIAPHKGKVVMVDLWNTWCGPCRGAIKITEPLKDTELNDDDIVWIYIADESSDPVKYLEMIPGIRGLHYKVNMDQKRALNNRFNVDGIPFYILVDRDGNAEGRPDLRDHNKYIREIKAKLQH